MLNQYNTIKYSLLVFRISWRIRQMRIYSLITKCQIIDQYVENSLSLFLENQANVQQLSKLMREPILAWDESKDSLDIILEMNMDKILDHPVLIEILNLIYEGVFTVDSNYLELSQTFSSLFYMRAFEMKSIFAKLWHNVKNLGIFPGDKRQSGLHFHIWKNCIEERLLDETMISGLIWAFFFFNVSSYLGMSANFKAMNDKIFGEEFVYATHILLSSEPSRKMMFC